MSSVLLTEPRSAEMDPCGQLLERARALVEERGLTTVLAWKAAHPGQLAVGHLPIYAPRPLLESLGILPVAVFGGGEEVDIIRGDSYFQSYICHIPRSTVEIGLAGELDALDGMLFPSICDVIRNLGGMWKLLFPNRYSAYLDLPQNYDPAVGGRFYRHELERIAGELHARGAWAYDPERLRVAMHSENRRRRAIEALDLLRREQPWRCLASEAYLLVRAGSALMSDVHADMLEAFVAAAKTRPGRPLDNVRVVLTGSFCEQPPVALIRALEKAGCDIVDDDFQLGLRMIDGDHDTASDDPLRSLAEAFTRQGRQTASRYIGHHVKGEALVEQVRVAKADGVVFAAASFCDPALLDQPMEEAALERAGIPFTSFKFSENTGQFQVIREQAGAFSDSVKLWGAAH